MTQAVLRCVILRHGCVILASQTGGLASSATTSTGGGQEKRGRQVGASIRRRVSQTGMGEDNREKAHLGLITSRHFQSFSCYLEKNQEEEK
jgi:hypothetical protein